MIDEKPPIGVEEVAEATAILQKYKAGKAALDKRIVANFFYFLICCLSPIYIFRFRLMLKQC